MRILKLALLAAIITGSLLALGASGQHVIWGLLLNPAADGHEMMDGTLNPLSAIEIRRAINRGINRQDLLTAYSGSGVSDMMYTPMSMVWCCSDTYFGNEIRLSPTGIDNEHFCQIIDDQMLALSARMNADGHYVYDGEVVELTFIVRTDTNDGRDLAAEKIKALLESTGLLVTMKAVTDYSWNEILWIENPIQGNWHLALTGWVGQDVHRPLQRIRQYYAPSGMQLPGCYNPPANVEWWEYENSDIEADLVDAAATTNLVDYLKFLEEAVLEGLRESVQIAIGGFD